MDSVTFSVWAEHILVPTLKLTDIVVIDNLSVHRNAAARAAVEATGAQVWDLPSYSPAPSSIETRWSKVKARLRKTKARAAETFHQAIGEAMERVTREDIQNWFDSCG
jgi:transposase